MQWGFGNSGWDNGGWGYWVELELHISLFIYFKKYKHSCNKSNPEKNMKSLNILWCFCFPQFCVCIIAGNLQKYQDRISGTCQSCFGRAVFRRNWVWQISKLKLNSILCVLVVFQCPLGISIFVQPGPTKSFCAQPGPVGFN